MEIDLTGRTAIVTGAGRGIGESIALEFAERGANIVAAARTESEIERTVEGVRDRGVDGLAVPTDLTSVEQIERLVDETVESFGTPEILVNNAGANIPTATLEMSLEEVDTTIGVNFRGLFLLSQRYGQVVNESPVDSGRIINISSIHGYLGTVSRSVYAGTKAGVFGLTRGLAAELAPVGVTVNSVSPGLTAVDRIQRLVEEYGEDRYDIELVPLGRLAEPDEIAYACLFLASEYAEYITGVDLPVDGGVIMTAGLY